MYLGEPTIEDMKNSIDIVDYIGRHVDLKKHGINHFGCCPFHNENSPSFSVHEGKQFFYCFGCGAGGDVFDFAQQLFNLNNYGTVQQLKSELGLIAGQKVEKVERKLTAEQEKAEAFLSSCTLETPCGALFQYGIVLPSGYEKDGNLVVPLRSKRGLEDVFILDGGRGRQLNGHLGDAWHTVGAYDEHSPSLYLCSDYIDATYLHKETGGNRLIIFAPNLFRAEERARREFPDKQIRLATSNYEGATDYWHGLYTMPAENGYWCEKDRHQPIQGLKKA